MKTTGIYIDIESLLDLRQAFLIKNVSDKDSLEKYLLGDDYNFRDTDTFSKFTMLDYREELEKGAMYFLEGSIITRNIVTVRSKIDGIEQRNKFYGESSVPLLYVNTYPYVFSGESLESFRNAIFSKLRTEVIIEIISMPPGDLTPNVFQELSLSVALIYDVTSWLEANSSKLLNNPIRDCLIYFPPIYSKAPTREELKAIGKTGFKDPMTYLEYVLSPVAKINFLPMVFYSNVAVAIRYIDKLSDGIKKEFSNFDPGVDYGDKLSEIEIP